MARQRERQLLVQIEEAVDDPMLKRLRQLAELDEPDTPAGFPGNPRWG